MSKRIAADIVGRILDTLLGLHLDPVTQPYLELGMVDRFVAVGPSSYDDIRRMVDACEAAGFMELR